MDRGIDAASKDGRGAAEGVTGLGAYLLPEPGDLDIYRSEPS
jgi:hypothetical protein